jgi:hypothetical protein
MRTLIFGPRLSWSVIQINLHRVREPSMRHYVNARQLKVAGMDWTHVVTAQDENPLAKFAAEPRSAQQP